MTSAYRVTVGEILHHCKHFECFYYTRKNFTPLDDWTLMKGPPHVRLCLKEGILYHGEILHHLHTGIASGVKFSHGSTTLLKSATILHVTFDLT